MKEGVLPDEVDCVLKKAGYEVSKFTPRRSCFDIVAVKKKKLLLIKVIKDLKKIQRVHSSDLLVVSEAFSATPLFIGVKSGETTLNDDTLYERYNIRAFSFRTLEDVISKNTNPLVVAGPGGYYVNVDGERLKKRRQELGLSIGKLAEMVSVSRGTIYSYEKGATKATVSIAYRLEKALGAPVIRPVDPLHRPSRTSARNRFPLDITKMNPYLRRIYKKLTRLNCTIAPIRRAPFDFIIRRSTKEICIIGFFSKIKNKENRRVSEFLSFSKTVNTRSLIVTKARCRLELAAPKISIRDLERVNDLEELLSEH